MCKAQAEQGSDLQHYSRIKSNSTLMILMIFHSGWLTPEGIYPSGIRGEDWLQDLMQLAKETWKSR